MVRAAAYMANSNDASVGMESAGTTASGRTIAAMEKPLATRTLMAVTSEASCIALIVVIDFAFRSRCQTPRPSGRFHQLHNRLHRHIDVIGNVRTFCLLTRERSVASRRP